MNESAFITATEHLLTTIANTIEAQCEDCDWELANGILTIECDDGAKIIINRHQPMQEIWVAARSGGFHFKHVGDDWVDSRDGQTLAQRLSAIFAEHQAIIAFPRW